MTAPQRTLSAFLLAFIDLGATTALANDPPRSRTFELTYQATIKDVPEGTKLLEIWLPLPQTDASQTIERITVEGACPVTIGREPERGNQSLYARVERPKGDVALTLQVTATRREYAGQAADLSPEERSSYLAAEPLVPLDGPVRSLAIEATRGKSTDAEKARAIYDTVTTLLKYDKSGTGWGRGDAVFACDARRGNCTDFHALLIGMARSVGIPARFAIGVSLPETRGSGELPGYHCWAEVYVKGRGWVPVDSSEASKDPSKRDYFFGHHDENRLEFSRGRHLTLSPAQSGPPLNFFIYPYAEVDGKAHGLVERKFTYRDK